MTFKVIVKKTSLTLMVGDITDLDCDAIVNAANCHLLLGAGVAGAIRIKGGPSIQEECDKIGQMPVGSAAITNAGNLKAKYVIHAVGPKMGEGDEKNKLKNATLSSLRLAEENQLKSIAFPAISTGIFGFPVADCAKIMIKTAFEYAQANTKLEKITFCLYTDDIYQEFKDKLEALTPESIV